MSTEKEGRKGHERGKEYNEKVGKAMKKPVTDGGRVMAKKEQGRNLQRLYSLKRGAQQGEMALIRDLC